VDFYGVTMVHSGLKRTAGTIGRLLLLLPHSKSPGSFAVEELVAAAAEASESDAELTEGCDYGLDSCLNSMEEF
jgi:hypothetical protein